MTSGKDLLRFVTAGNVDDGKSTLIGRLLHDSKAILEDQLEALREASARRGDSDLNLALLTDGLRAEREQGITIDVAYRYFSTPRRKFIIADCPGHLQYTRNMVTGASNANLAIVLVDARKGLVEQTRRHCFVASILQIPHLVLCVNKMDLVGYAQDAFERVRAEFTEFSRKLEISDVAFIPVSALTGENIVEPSERMEWYSGRSLLSHLEEVHIASDLNSIDFRLPIQLASFQRGESERRSYLGAIASGTVRVGDEVLALPSGLRTQVRSLEAAGRKVESAGAPLSVAVELADEIDLGRGDMLVRPRNRPHSAESLEAVLCWMGSSPLETSRRYVLRHTTSEALARVREITYAFDINTLSRIEGVPELKLNDFARVKVTASKPLFFDPYRQNRGTGSFILIDEASCNTVAAGMIIGPGD